MGEKVLLWMDDDDPVPQNVFEICILESEIPIPHKIPIVQLAMLVSLVQQKQQSDDGWGLPCQLIGHAALVPVHNSNLNL